MKKGFFLIEALVAVLILGILAVSFSSSLSAGVASTQGSRSRMQAIVQADDAMEQIRWHWQQTPCQISISDDATTTPLVFATDIFSVMYKATSLDPSDIDAGFAANTLFLVELTVTPKAEAQGSETVRLKTILGSRNVP